MTTGTSTIITGLTNSVSYTFTVAAHSLAGYGPNSNVVNSVPRTVPSAPTLLTASPGNGQISLSWTAPATGGSAIDYYIIYQDGVDVKHVPTGTSTTIVALSNGESYSFTVLAHNVAGNGPVSTATVSVPRTIPNAPTGLAATPGNGQVSLTWTAPANGGSAIDYYAIYQGGVKVATAATTSIVVTGLTNGVS